MKNNNQKVIKKLSQRTMKQSRMRNFFAVAAICLTTLLFTAVFSMGFGMMQMIQEPVSYTHLLRKGQVQRTEHKKLDR